MTTKLNEIRLAVLTPMGSNIYPVNVSCFLYLVGALRHVFHPASCFFWVEGGPYILQNRTYLLRSAMMHDFSQKFNYVLWIDADQVFGVEHVAILAATAIKSNLDGVSGLYYNRHGERHSLVGRLTNEHNDVYWLRDRDFALQSDQNMVMKIDVCGFGFFMVGMEALRQYCEQYPRERWFTQDWHGSAKIRYSGEDVSFCHQFKSIGKQIWFAPFVKVGHYGAIVPSDFRRSNAPNRFEDVNVM